MRLRSWAVIPLSLLICLQTLDASVWDWFSSPHRLIVGHEVSYLERTKRGGVKQTGILYGGKVAYEHLKGWAPYFSLEGYAAKGILCGKTDTWRLRSCKEDWEAIGKLGWTFSFSSYSLTPFIGYGRFDGTNQFRTPTPLRVKFETKLDYCAAGLIAYLNCGRWDFGIDFTYKSLTDGKTKVTNDPDFDDCELFFEFHPHYAVELPIRYRQNTSLGCLEFSLVPYYRYRRYGERENFLFTFVDTRIQLFGGRISLASIF